MAGIAGAGAEGEGPKDIQADWQCTKCTFHNGEEALSCKMCLTSRPTPLESYGDDVSVPECRLILAGKTGTGKSSVGNTLLGEEKFKVTPSSRGETEICERACARSFGKRLQVIDTPGLFDISRSLEVLQKEISRCIVMSLPGPHAFLLVFRIGRFTPEDQETVEKFTQIFGEQMLRYAVVVFTGADELTRHRINIEDYIEDAVQEIKTLLEKCGNRYICINNFDEPEEKERACQRLIGIVDDIPNNNEEPFYTNEIYTRAMKPFDELKEALLTECKKDQTLPRWQQKERESEYKEGLQICQARLDSLHCEGGATLDEIMSEMRALSLKLDVIKGELSRQRLGDDDLEKRTSQVQSEELEQYRMQPSWNMKWVVDIIQEIAPILMEIIRLFNLVRT